MEQMTPDRMIQLVLALVGAALAIALWFAKREKDAGSSEAATKGTVKDIDERVVALERRHQAEDQRAIEAAQAYGQRLEQFRQTREQVDEIDDRLDEAVTHLDVVDDRLTSVEGRVGVVEKHQGLSPPPVRHSMTRPK